MKQLYSKIILIAMLAFGFNAAAQCTSCTITIAGADAANHIVNSGTTLCVSPTGSLSGLITVLTGGTLCNEGTINSPNVWVAGGVLNNYGTMNTSNILVSGQGFGYNYGTITMDSLLVTNIYSTLVNYGSITGDRMGNSDFSSITNNGNVSVDYMADSAASFTNNTDGSFIVNVDFANAYNSGYFNYGYFKVTRDFYNSFGSTFEAHCMGIVGRDWYNTAIVVGPPTGSCGGFNIAAGSYNTGTLGSSLTHLDLCDAGHPAFGIDGPSGSIASSTTYCACSNACVQVTGIETLQASAVSIGSVYPNPATSNISIELNAIEPEGLVVEVYDMMGRKQSASSFKALVGINKLDLQVAGLAQGTYVLSITDSKKLQSKKMFSVVK